GMAGALAGTRLEGIALREECASMLEAHRKTATEKDTRMPQGSVVTYGDHPSQSATLHVAQRKSPMLTCLLHGGFWRVPHGPGQLSDLAAALCIKGHTVLNAGYRRTGEGGGWPRSVRDVA